MVKDDLFIEKKELSLFLTPQDLSIDWQFMPPHIDFDAVIYLFNVEDKPSFEKLKQLHDQYSEKPNFPKSAPSYLLSCDALHFESTTHTYIVSNPFSHSVTTPISISLIDEEYVEIAELDKIPPPEFFGSEKEDSPNHTDDKQPDPCISPTSLPPYVSEEDIPDAVSNTKTIHSFTSDIIKKISDSMSYDYHPKYPLVTDPEIASMQSYLKCSTEITSIKLSNERDTCQTILSVIAHIQEYSSNLATKIKCVVLGDSAVGKSHLCNLIQLELDRHMKQDTSLYRSPLLCSGFLSKGISPISRESHFKTYGISKSEFKKKMGTMESKIISKMKDKRKKMIKSVSPTIDVRRCITEHVCQYQFHQPGKTFTIDLVDTPGLPCNFYTSDSRIPMSSHQDSMSASVRPSCVLYHNVDCGIFVYNADLPPDSIILSLEKWLHEFYCEALMSMRIVSERSYWEGVLGEQPEKWVERDCEKKFKDHVKEKCRDRRKRPLVSTSLPVSAGIPLSWRSEEIKEAHQSLSAEEKEIRSSIPILIVGNSRKSGKFHGPDNAVLEENHKLILRSLKESFLNGCSKCHFDGILCDDIAKSILIPKSPIYSKISKFFKASTSTSVNDLRAKLRKIAKDSCVEHDDEKSEDSSESEASYEGTDSSESEDD
ncbi:hypothetical protein ADUPG1_008464 [Aduncisulcus paluster]|uniref:Uncharacterized protein n=1 Tax=Aduncisulcus paluster TaxID=2918883 RepID=A0ABQ5KS21_9EUKA|nr:hypothetical protein ADUPG1_008464 [Aduncisulcus paluster]